MADRLKGGTRLALRLRQVHADLGVRGARRHPQQPREHLALLGRQALPEARDHVPPPLGVRLCGRRGELSRVNGAGGGRRLLLPGGGGAATAASTSGPGHFVSIIKMVFDLVLCFSLF